jgi:rhodanese-related sulfurtransferase
MSLKKINSAEAKRLMDEGAVLIDIREPDEFARERVRGARNRPLGDLSTMSNEGAAVIIFHCRSGMRTEANAARLSQACGCEAYILEGGLEAWKKAGFPVVLDVHQPLEIMRQVQITAGTLVLLGVILGTWLTPVFYGLSAFVGAGLAFAGATGWCGMAKLLALMPWNRRVAQVVAA